MGGEYFYGTPTLDISDQTSNYPVIACGTSTVNYSSEVTSYTTTLLNQCGLVEFTTTNEIPVGKTIFISGVRNKVTLDFATSSIIPSEETGTIFLHTESTTVSRAILLPTTEPMTVTACAPGYSPVEITIPAIGNNAYLAGVNGPNFTLTESPIVDLSTIILNDYEAQDGETLTGTAVNDDLHITIAASATVTLSNATINSGRIECLGDATLVLADGTANSVHSSYSGIYVPEESTLIITGSGSLVADASDSSGGAGIGAFYWTNCGNIYIEGGTITATGGIAAAGIGGGAYADCGDITITSDVTRVTATGGGYGACCIGHSDGSCGTITIGSYSMGDCVEGEGGTYVYESEPW